MPTIPVGYYEATLIWQRSGSVRPSTVGLGLEDDVPGNRSPVTVADAVYAAATNLASIAPGVVMSTSYSFLGVSVSRMTEEGPLVGEKLTTIIGTGTETVMPPNCAVLVNKVTGLGGRRNRGRFFVPPYYPPEGSVDSNGVLNPTAVTTVRDRWVDFLTRLGTAGLVPVMFHNTAPFLPTPIVGIAVNPLIATQRRRLRK